MKLDIFDPVSIGTAAAYGAYNAYRYYKRDYPPYESDNFDMPKFNSGYSMVTRPARGRRKGRFRHKKVSPYKAPTLMMDKISINHHYRCETEIQRGRLLLPNHATDNLGGAYANRNYVPMHIYEINNTPWDYNKDLSSIYQVSQSNSNASTWNMEISPYNKTVTDGESTNTDQYTRNVTTSSHLWSDNPSWQSSSLSRIRKMYHKGVKVELLMYGQSNHDTLFRVDIVQFDPRFAENFNGDTWSFTDDEWGQTMHSLVAPYMMNPAYKPTRPRNMYKVIKSYTWKIPEQSSDFDRVNSVRTKFYIPMNTIVNRYWKTGAPPAYVENSSTMNAVQDSGSDVQAQLGRLAPEKRYFMVIRATNNNRTINEDSTGPISSSVGEDPTYDITFSSRFSYLVDSV